MLLKLALSWGVFNWRQSPEVKNDPNTDSRIFKIGSEIEKKRWISQLTIKQFRFFFLLNYTREILSNMIAPSRSYAMISEKEYKNILTQCTHKKNSVPTKQCFSLHSSTTHILDCDHWSESSSKAKDDAHWISKLIELRLFALLYFFCSFSFTTCRGPITSHWTYGKMKIQGRWKKKEIHFIFFLPSFSCCAFCSVRVAFIHVYLASTAGSKKNDMLARVLWWPHITHQHSET